MTDNVHLLRCELARMAGRWEQLGRGDWHEYKGYAELLPILADALDEAGEVLEAAACRCRWQAKFGRWNYSHWRVLPPAWNEQHFRQFVGTKERHEHRPTWKRANGHLHTNAAPLLHFPAGTLRLVGKSVDGRTPDAAKETPYRDYEKRVATYLRFTFTSKRGTAGSGNRLDTEVVEGGYLGLFAGGVAQPLPPRKEPHDPVPLFDAADVWEETAP
jgi:hypothetical protein